LERLIPVHEENLMLLLKRTREHGSKPREEIWDTYVGSATPKPRLKVEIGISILPVVAQPQRIEKGLKPLWFHSPWD